MSKLPLVTSATPESGPTKISVVPNGITEEPKAYFDTDSGVLFTEKLDSPLFTSEEKGLVPASGEDESLFLRADGTWAEPPQFGQITAEVGSPITVTGDVDNPVIGMDQTLIAIEQSQVTDLVTDLAGKVPTTRQVVAGTGLSGGGALSSDVTLSLPNVGTEGTYGSASSVAVIATDAQGRVSSATTTAIEVAQSQVLGLVADLESKADKTVTATAGAGLTGGGTLASNFSFGLSTVGTAKTDQGSASKTVTVSTDSYGRVTSLTEQPISNLSGGAINSGKVGLAYGGTGIDLSDIGEAQIIVGLAAGGDVGPVSVSGDASLSAEGALTVTGLQSNPVSSTELGAPDAGKALVWSGTEWQASNIQGGGGGGGLTFFMNYAASSPYPMSPQFDEVTGWDTSAIQVANDTNGTTLGTFVTAVGAPAIEVIPSGLWDVNFYAQGSNGVNSTAVRVKIATLAGTTQTVIATSDWVYLSDPNVVAAYSASAYVPLTDISLADRIEIIFEGRRFDVETQSITLHFGNDSITHAHTTVNAPGGTGLVKVVDGYLQSPASLLVNADVASDAAIAVSKLAAGTDTYVLTTVAGVPTWSIPPALGVTTLTGTADQVLVDATSAEPKTGALTLTLPQGIGIGSSPTFAGLTLGSLSGLLRATAGVLAGGTSVSLTSEVFGTLPIANGGTNLTSSGASGNLLVSNGAGWASVAMTGDASIASTGALTLKNTGSAGTYGSSSAVPVFVTDSQGRVTGVTNTNIDFANNTVTSLTGTANQVVVSASTGAVVLSLPQSIATTSSPTFAGMTVSGASTSRLTFATSAEMRTSSNGLLTLFPNGGTLVDVLVNSVSGTSGNNFRLRGGSNTSDTGKGGHLLLAGGSGTGLNTSGGDLYITGGVPAGTGIRGAIYIGNEFPIGAVGASSIRIGHSTITTTINGTANIATIGSASSVVTVTNAILQVSETTGLSILRGAPYNGVGRLTVSGPNSSATGGAGGMLRLTGGLGQGAGASGPIEIGTLVTSAITIGAAGITTTVDGTLAAATAAVDTNTTQVATTAFVVGQGYLNSATAASTYQTIAGMSAYAPLASPTFTGTVTIPTLNAFLLRGANTSVTGATAGNLSLKGGSGTGTDNSGGDLYLAAGAKTGTGTDGKIYIGDLTTSAVFIGASTITTRLYGPVEFNDYIKNANLYLGGVTGSTIAPYARNYPDGGYPLTIRGDDNSAGSAGDLVLRGGTSTASAGGDARLFGGNGATEGGYVIIEAGYGATAGADTYVTGGQCQTGTNTKGGDVYINGGLQRGTGTLGLVRIANSNGNVQIGRAASTTTFYGAVSLATGSTLTLSTALGPTSGGTGISSYALGDLLYASATNTLSKLAAGTSGQVLTMSGGVPTWQPASGGGVTSVQGTGNQVLVNSTGGVPKTGALTLTLPQDIGIGSVPTFGGLKVGIVGGGIEKITQNGGDSFYVRGDPAGFGGDGGILYLSGGRAAATDANGGKVEVNGGWTYSQNGTAGAVQITGGYGQGVNGTGGGASLDAGTGNYANGAVSIGGANAASVNIGRAGINVSISGSLIVSLANGYVRAASNVISSAATIPVSDVTGAAPLASPTFTGTVTLPLTTAGYVKTTSAGAISSSASVPTSDLSGAVAIANGGTNNASLSVAHGTIYYGDGSKLVGLAPGTSGQFLQTQGVNANPQWASSGGATPPYDLRGKFIGTPASSVVLDTFIADRLATISATNTDHKFSAKTLPSAGVVVLTVQRTRTTLGVPSTVTVFTATSASTDTILNGYYPMTISLVTNNDILADDVIEVVMQLEDVNPSFSTPVWTISATA